MAQNLQLTLSLSALLQGLMIMAMAIIGFFFRREMAKLDEGRGRQIAATKKIYEMLDELKEQHRHCLLLFASKESLNDVFARLSQHDRELGELRGWKNEHIDHSRHSEKERG